MAFDLDEEEEEEEEESYLASYSDLVTDLMAVFVLLFSFATMSLTQQNALLRNETEEIREQQQMEQEAKKKAEEQAKEAQDDLDSVYEAIREKIASGEYSDGISLERGEGYITFKFKDSLLFHPDSPVMRTESTDILEYMGLLLLGVESNIATISISGHTAKVSEDTNANTVAWRLSSDRAIAVLQFFVNECHISQSKMAVAGYAHYRPVASNDTEEGKAQNRRVEIKITRTDE